MKLSDRIKLKTVNTKYDERLNEIETIEWIDLGKCSIMPNTAAKVTRGNDGKEYLYAYEIIMKVPKNLFGSRIVPQEGDDIHIAKADGTINKECKVSGFVTLRNWLKIWV